MYTALLYIHIVSAIASIGPLYSMVLTVYRMNKASYDALPGYIQSIQASIDIVKHAGHVVVISGALLVITGSWTWASSWIVLTLLILIASLVFLAKAFKPTMRTFGTEEFNQEQFIKIMKRNTWIYIALLMVILCMMVVKPMIW